VLIPRGSLYKDTYLTMDVNGETATIHNKETPLHKKMTITFDVSHYNDKDKKQLYIGHINENNKPSYNRTSKKQNRFSIRTRTFGKYGLFSDVTKPDIVPINISSKKWISAKDAYLKIKINDTESGIKRYRGTLNGKFIVMEYDYKTGMLVYNFNDNIHADSENNFKLVVIDNVGNRATYETTFYKKP